MNAISKVQTPELNAERLVAVVTALPPLKSFDDDRRDQLVTALRQCQTELVADMEPADPENMLFLYQEDLFRLQPGDAGFHSDKEKPLDLFCDPNLDEQAFWDWQTRLGDRPPLADPWSYLLGEAERSAPGFSRTALATPLLQVWSEDDDDDNTPEFAWLAAGIPAHSLTCFNGEPAQGKSSLALSLAVHITAGLPFAGHNVLQGAVVYIAAEGHPRALQARIRAMRAGYGITGGDTRITLINGASKSLCRPGDVDSMISTIAAATGGQPVRAVFLDTLSQLMPGQDINGDLAMSQAVASLGRIRDAFSTAVIVISHPAKGGRDPRGSQCLKGALDALFFVSAKHKDGGIESVTLENTKQRDAPAAPDCVFDAIPDPEVFIPTCRVMEPASQAAPAATPKARLSPKAKLARAFLVKHGPATEDVWRVAVAGQLTSSLEGKAQRQAFYRVRDELKAAEAVILADNGQWRAVE